MYCYTSGQLITLPIVQFERRNQLRAILTRGNELSPDKAYQPVSIILKK